MTFDTLCLSRVRMTSPAALALATKWTSLLRTNWIFIHIENN